MTGLKLTILTVTALFWMGLTMARAADKDEHGFLDRVFKDADGTEAKYVLFVPHDYKGKKAFPTILFLHGAGETGTDGQKQARTGLGNAIRKQEQTFGFIAIFPQSQKRTWQADSDDGQRAMKILAQVQKTYKVDAKRLYLTGLSMGGFGTWSLAVRYPTKWAAIVPVCGGGDPSQAATIKHIPCWCFHGDADMAVKVDKSREMIKALKAAGGKPKYDEYPGVGHNSWDKAYGNPELYDWLLKQKLK
jgi:predicted peptidase